MAERVQLQRTKGWKMPPGTVKVDRSTRWGNPFTVIETSPKKLRHRFALAHEGKVFMTGLTLRDATDQAVMRFAAEVAPLLPVQELRGLNLACWCKPGRPCHADILLELANA